MPTYTIRDEAGGEETIKGTLDDALAFAERTYTGESGRRLLLETPTETEWWHVRILDEDGEDVGGGHYAVDPEEPDCDADAEDHDWQSPLSVVGGIRENPGVWGRGAGIQTRTVCAHCGAYRVTDSYAQCRTDGIQGLDSVRYEGADAKSRAWVAEQDEDEQEA